MLKIRPISNALQQTAKNHLNEVPNRVQDDIEHIRNWLAQQPHIRSRTDDQWILTFLRGTKFSLERTKEKLDLFYTMRTLMPAYYTNRDPFLPEIQAMLNQGVILPLPKTVGDSGARIILARCGRLNMKLPFETLAKTFLMMVDIMFLEDDNCVIAGQHIFGDFKGAPLEYVLITNPNEVKKIEICLEKAYPSRPQAIDIVNAPTIYETLINVVRSVLSSKIKNRVHVYSAKNAQEIYKIVPPSVLPKEYGGDCETVAEITDYWKKKVESYRDWFLEDEQFCVDETKRPGKPKTEGDMFGIEGSFRKLDID